MQHETFRGARVPELFSRARSVLGPDAVILSVRRLAGAEFEVTATDPESAAVSRGRTGRGGAPRRTGGPEAVTLETARPEKAGPDAAMQEPATSMTAKGGASSPKTAVPSFAEALASAAPALPAAGDRPAVIALVGPTGAGKTTTAAKLCRNAAAFAGRRVGVITLDGFRARALGQLRSYPGLSPYPMASVFTRDDVRPALKRMKGVEVILVDTPGRGPCGREDAVRIRECLWALRPDEVHFVLPAGLSTAAGLRAFGEARSFSPTHLLPTKLDEYPEDVAILSLARRLGLATRWAANGQRVPGDLRPFTLPEPGRARPTRPEILEAAAGR
jgi:flagellar biosynthesis GTPase FlhF